jgi:hypothetical protein
MRGDDRPFRRGPSPRPLTLFYLAISVAILVSVFSISGATRAIPTASRPSWAAAPISTPAATSISAPNPSGTPIPTPAATPAPPPTPAADAAPGLSCPKCHFAPFAAATSTRRDVVLAAALTALKRVEYFLRTLRTTGTRARVVLFLDCPRTATPEWRRFFSACAVEPVFVNTSSSVLREVPKLSRYYFYYQWLSAHISEVDRVIHTDTFDVIFQSDPFTQSLNASRLYFMFEPVSISDSRWTASWISDCYNHSFFSKHGGKPVSCSGVTAGGGQPFLRPVVGP